MTTTLTPAAGPVAAGGESWVPGDSSRASSTAEVLAWCARDAQQDAEYQEFLDSLELSGAGGDAAPTPSPPRHTAPAASPSLAHLDTLLDEVADLESRIGGLHARRARLVAAIGRAVAGMDADLVDDTDPTARASSRARRYELAERAAVTELATVLHVGEHAAGTVLDHARTLTTKAPGTLAALEQGHLTWAHASQVAKHLADLTAPAAAQVEAAVLPSAGSRTPAQLAAATRRAREVAHPTSLEVRHAEAAARRAVYLDAGHDGMAWLVAHLPAPLAHAAYDRLARTAAHLTDLPGEDRTRDQLHADALTALLLDSESSADSTPGPHQDTCGSAHTAVAPTTAEGTDSTSGCQAHPLPRRLDDDIPGAPPPSGRDPVALMARGIRPRVNVTVPVLSLLGRSDEPALLDGLVPLDPTTARNLCAGAPSFRRLLTHPATGRLLAADPGSYAVPAGLRALLTERDPTCRFPGCTRPAFRTDLDHTTAWADGGTTTAANLAHVCRHHHVIKHQTRWTVRQVPARTSTDAPLDPLGGVLEWTSPTGRTYRTHPARPASTLHSAPPHVDVPDEPDPPPF